VRRAPPVLLAIEGLTRRFRADELPAVTDVSFTVAEGELLALLGPSGCGKTTTLRMIGGFETPDAGTVRLHDRDITHLPPEKRGIGFVFQDYALFPHLSVLDNVRFGLRGRPKAEAAARAREMLALVGLPTSPRACPTSSPAASSSASRSPAPSPSRPPSSCSTSPSPTSTPRCASRPARRCAPCSSRRAPRRSSSPTTRRRRWRLPTAIAVMEGGRIAQVGTPAEIYREPVSEFVASFIGRSNIVRGQASGAWAETIFGNLNLLHEAAGDVRLAVRPEQITLHPDPAGSGLIVGREFRGHDQLYWVRAADRTVLAISGPVPIIDIGTRVRLEVCDCVVPLGA
jgi:iron(III) transport system ATP-binding protein